jgi:hypothetical protein
VLLYVHSWLQPRLVAELVGRNSRFVASEIAFSPFFNAARSLSNYLETRAVQRHATVEM